MENVKLSYNVFVFIKFQGKKFMLQENYAQSGRIAYNYSPQFQIFSEIYLVKFEKWKYH